MYYYEFVLHTDGSGSEWIVYHYRNGVKTFICSCSREELADWLAYQFNQEKQK